MVRVRISSYMEGVSDPFVTKELNLLNEAEFSLLMEEVEKINRGGRWFHELERLQEQVFKAKEVILYK